MEWSRQADTFDNSFERGKQLAAQGKLPEAVQLLEAVCAQAPTPDRWLALAACYFRQTRNEECREALRKALALDPEHRPTRRFLKQITGSEAIPAASSGRRPIRVREETPRPTAMAQDSETRPGCLGAMLVAILATLGILFRAG